MSIINPSPSQQTCKQFKPTIGNTQKHNHSTITTPINHSRSSPRAHMKSAQNYHSRASCLKTQSYQLHHHLKAGSIALILAAGISSDHHHRLSATVVPRDDNLNSPTPVATSVRITIMEALLIKPITPLQSADFSSNRETVVVAHRLSTNANVIAVVKDGDIPNVSFGAINPSLVEKGFLLVVGKSVRSSSMYTKIFIWCEVSQTDVHDGPYPPRSRCKSLLIRFKNMVVSGCFEFKPPQFVYNFNPARVAHDASKTWVNTSTQKRYTEAILCAVLGHMGIDEKEHPAITEKIFEAVEVAVPLPQLAIDVTIWNMVACVWGRFKYHDDVLYRHVRKSWGEFTAVASCSSTQMPPSCAVCLEDFGEVGRGVVDRMITRLPCLHYFHGHCIAPWVKIRPACPLCRCQLMPILCDDESGSPNPNPHGIGLSN